jgi:hypothetical protein
MTDLYPYLIAFLIGMILMFLIDRERTSRR